MGWGVNDNLSTLSWDSNIGAEGGGGGDFYSEGLADARANQSKGNEEKDLDF